MNLLHSIIATFRVQAEPTNGHGRNVAPYDETCHASFPHPNPLGETTSHSTRLQETAAKSLVTPEGDGANESLREFQVKVVALDAYRDVYLVDQIPGGDSLRSM